MNSYIGCFGLLGIAGFILLLYFLRKQNDNEMTEFYKAHSLYRTTDEPPNVRESLGAASENLYCCQANLTTATGERVAFGWWEWYLKSNTVINGAPSVSFTHFLAFSFAPNSVGDDFIGKALQSTDRSEDSVGQKVKDFFVADTQNPYRAEILADGTLIICWQITYRRDAYEAKLEWLRNKISLPVAPANTAPEKVEDTMPDESKTIEIAAPNDSSIAGTIFYTHDSYATLRHKFNSAWTNLDVELHHSSAKFQHEGYDEFDIDATFGDANSPNEIAFTLDDETIVRTAARLFSEKFGGEAYILRDGNSVEDKESLGYCNNPFKLLLNEFTYGEFKRRFTGRWMNLSIELYDTSPLAGGLRRGDRELADDFDMTTLKHADEAFLHDYIYISTWGEKLVYIRAAAWIKNDKFGVYCEGNLRNAELKEFNEVDTSESLRIMSIR